MDNEQIARRFNRMAALMEVRGEDSFRIRSYRMAAEAIETWPVEMKQIATAEGAQRQAAAQRLRQNHQIRHDAEVLEREESARATEAGQNLIKDQERAGCRTALAQSRYEILAWNSDPPLRLNWLDHYCGYTRIDRP
jgi:DNA polymerase (family 10)